MRDTIPDNLSVDIREKHETFLGQPPFQLRSNSQLFCDLYADLLTVQIDLQIEIISIHTNYERLDNNYKESY